MSGFRVFTAIALVALCAGSAAAQPRPPSPLPPLPGPYAPPTTVPGAQAPAASANPLERAKRGVVAIERDGRTLGIGTVLAGDGRILTALSPLGTSDNADVRYADGTSVHAKLGHRDKTWDLALLIPLTGRWTDGLPASESDPAGTELHAFASAGHGKMTVLPTNLKGKIDARAQEGDTLPSVLDVVAQGVPPALGSPIVDGNGSVVGIIVRACKDIAVAPPDGKAAQLPCAPVVIGAPIPSIRHFLATTPANAVAPAPWLGIRGEPDSSGNVRGVRVTAVAPGSPAALIGLKTSTERALSDLIVAVDGHPIDTPEKLAETIAKHAVGDPVKLLVFSNDHFRDVTVALRAAP